jgi:hypothetical protein
MEECRSLIARFPHLELEIRRRCASDPGFMSICADYEEAAAALRYWQGISPDYGSRVEEYKRFLEELEAEILTQLETTQAPEGT